MGTGPILIEHRAQTGRLHCLLQPYRRVVSCINEVSLFSLCLGTFMCLPRTAVLVVSLILAIQGLAALIRAQMWPITNGFNGAEEREKGKGGQLLLN